jgi:hypothetical protein
MLRAKTIILFLLSGFFLLQTCKSKDPKRETKAGLELSAQLGGIIYLDTTPTLHVVTTLSNPTNDTLSFVSMTCSYEDMFLTDTSAFKVRSRNDCFSNFPTVIALPPHKKLDQFIMVRPVAKDVKTIENKIRIGMYYLKPQKGEDFDGIIKQYENRQQAMVLWSGELDLKRLYRKIYQ